MYNNKPIVYKKERRNKPDFICRWLEAAVAIVWITLFTALLFYQNAQPQAETFLERYFEVKPREVWDYQMMEGVFYILLFLFLFSVFSLYLNSKRLKRSADRFRVSFVISLVGSLVGMLLYIIRFM